MITALKACGAPDSLVDAYKQQYKLLGLMPSDGSTPSPSPAAGGGTPTPTGAAGTPTPGAPTDPTATSSTPTAGGTPTPTAGGAPTPSASPASGGASGGSSTTYGNGDAYAGLAAPNTGITGTQVAKDTLKPAGGGPDIATSGPLKGLSYGNEVAAAAAKYGIDPFLLYGQGVVESGGNGLDGTIGVAPSTGGGGGWQMTPGWQSPKGSTFDAAYNGSDPGSQVMAAAQADRILINEAGGDVEKGFSSYNSGNTNELWNPAALPAKDYHSYYDDASDIGQKIKAYEAGNA